jgi:antirestriction protein ArdC
MSEKTDNIIQSLTQKMVDAMKNDPTGWTKPWQGISGLPHNAQTGNVYSGGNALILMMLSPDDSDSRWSTYKGWEKLGGQVRKGETGTGILFFSRSWFHVDSKKWSSKTPADTTGWEERGVLRAYTVFHASQVDGAPAKPEQPVVSEDIDVEIHRDWFRTMGADWRETPSDRAFYSPSEDYINTPEDIQFESPEGWFGTVAHEFTHWTGHADRLDRRSERGKNGSRDEYAFEELVAELGATFLSVIRGVETDPRPDHERYIASWLKALDNDPRFIWDAAGKSSKAVNYILENTTTPAAIEVPVA